jgi:transposase
MIDGESQSEPTREELIALIRAQAAEIAALKARVAELERRLGLNSTNSGKPPSSDGLKKPPRTRSLREPSNRKPGGQKGHKGETLRQVAKPDTVIDHFPFSCADCSEELIPAMSTGYSARQVFDLPEPPPPIVTEHRAHVSQCRPSMFVDDNPYSAKTERNWTTNCMNVFSGR